MFSNGLTKADAERLALLLEEMGEAQHAIGKILRHGYESVNPDDLESPTNRQALAHEIGDVLCALDMMVNANDLPRKLIEQRRVEKAERVTRYLHHQ